MTIEPGGPRRLPAGAVATISGLRVDPPGSEAALVNISPTGLLAESPAKLRVGTLVEVQFHGGFTPASIKGRVVRCEVAVMQKDGLRYHIGIEFDSVIAPAEEERSREVVPPAVPKGVRNGW